jgi:hypothetical protein
MLSSTARQQVNTRESLLSDEYHVLQNNITSPGHCFTKRTMSNSRCDPAKNDTLSGTDPPQRRAAGSPHSLLLTTPLIPYAGIADIENHTGCGIRYKNSAVRNHILARRVERTHPCLVRGPVATLRERRLVRDLRAGEVRAAAGRAGTEAATSQERQPHTIKPQSCGRTRRLHSVLDGTKRQ